MEYIEREAAKNAFPRAEADAFENCRYCTCLDSEQIGKILDNVPAADVVPVRHGRWEQKEMFEAKGNVEELQSAFCSVCQRYHTTPYSYYFNHYSYCPNCGALMKDGDGE